MTNLQLESSEFKPFIGKRLKKYRTPDLESSAVIYILVEITIGDETYDLSNFIGDVSYLGEEEYIGIFELNKTGKQALSLLGENPKEIIVDKTISKITLIHKTQRLYKNNRLKDTCKLTRAIIFEFNQGDKLLFEKDIEDSDDIFIYSGNGVESEIATEEEISNAWKDFLQEHHRLNERFSCERTVEIIQ